jgi:hypothetical protein
MKNEMARTCQVNVLAVLFLLNCMELPIIAGPVGAGNKFSWQKLE